jgi:ABC-type multidrug transport system fused ATPase/permease subunit
VTKSPLYTIYGESISGVAVLRAFGASTKFLKEMHSHVDTNTNPYYWMWSVNRWLSVRFNMLSAVVIGVTAAVVLLNKSVDASFAGFALMFASNVTMDLLFMVRTPLMIFSGWC